MTDSATPAERLRPLRRVRQIREFTGEPVDPAELDAIADVARWTGSAMNQQPWRFIVIRDPATLRRFFDVGQPQTRSLGTAAAAIAIVLPGEAAEVGSAHAQLYTFDEGRAAERILAAATMLGLAGGIAWIRPDVLPAAREILGLPADRFVRTIVSLGHPTEAALQPKAAPGEGRLPREEVVYDERWPRG